MSGIGSLASAGTMLFSDRRLKREIKRIGSVAGLNLYEYVYIWGEKAVGVMADEVRKLYPDAVFKHNSGYDMVDYGKIFKGV